MLYADDYDVFEHKWNVEELVMRWLTPDIFLFVTQYC